MKKKFLVGIYFLLTSVFVCLSNVSFSQGMWLYPTNWWVGMKWNKVQLLVRSSDSELYKAKVVVTYPGVTMTGMHRFENGKYLALDLTIAPQTKPGAVIIDFNFTHFTDRLTWTLKERRQGNGTKYAQGVTSSDFIYLLMPDRFSNGDTTNDRVFGMRDQSLSRDSMYARHGGDSPRGHQPLGLSSKPWRDHRLDDAGPGKRHAEKNGTWLCFYEPLPDRAAFWRRADV